MSTIEYTVDDNEAIVHLFGRDKDNDRLHVRLYNFFPYFYVDSNTTVKKSNRIRKVIKNSAKNINGTSVKKIICNIPSDVGGDRKDNIGLRERFRKTYEDDIFFTNRVAIDLGIKSGFRFTREEDFELTYGEDEIIPVDFQANLRRIHHDIEVSTLESGGRVPNNKNPINPIYSIACYDNYMDKFFIFVWNDEFKNKTKECTKFFNPINIKNKFKAIYDLSIYKFNNERDMLKTYTRFIEKTDPDIITGWNNKKFDMPYVIRRMMRLKINYRRLSPLHSCYVDEKGIGKIKGRIIFDTWEGYKKTVINELESYKLDFVANELFKVGKVKHKGIDLMFEEEIDKLILYNVQDVFLEMAISENESVFQFFYDVKCYTGCAYEDVLNNSRIVDHYILSIAHKLGIALPSKRNRESDKFKGAVVIEPKRKGIQKWVSIIDLKSLYPMIMLMLNMGEDTLVLNPSPDQIPNLIRSPLKGVYFRKDKTSFLASILKDLLEKRDEYKGIMAGYYNVGDKHNAEIYNRLQTVVKFITNSIYGVLGWSNFRLYNKAIAACITATGRLVIQYTIKVIEKFGYENYYGDTDSIFPILKSDNEKDAVEEIEALTDKINEKYNIFIKLFNCDKNYFLMKPEKVLESILMVKKKGSKDVAKKKYVGISVWDEGKFERKIYIKGFKRSDQARKASEIMNKLFDFILEYRRNEEIIEYVNSELKLIRTKKLNIEELAFSKGIKRSLSTYGNQDWIRAARWTNYYSGLWGNQSNYGASSKPKFIYVSPTKLPEAYDRIEIVALDEDNSLPEFIKNAIDYEMVIQKCIGKKIENILDALGINWYFLSQKNQIKRLDNYARKT